MRTRFGLIASALMVFVIGCNTVDPDECWVNTSGGFGGGGTIPIGAGVGATTGGDFLAPPGGKPFAAEGVENPCVTMGSVTFASYSPSEFPFVTIVQDDGTDKAGGWQEAKANLEFIKKRREGSSTWTCPLTIGMPQRNEAYGKISASYAATMSAYVAEDVAYGMDFNLQQGIFCDRFVAGVKAAFPLMYPGLGERVKR